MLRRRPMVSKTYDFETTDLLYFYKFIEVLELFNIIPLNKYSGSYYDYHEVRFCCDKQTRLRIEYIFRRLLNMRCLYLLDLDNYQNIAKRYMEEKYAIY